MRVFSGLLLAALLAWPLQAQEPTIPEAPVRYDADLLPPAFHQSRRALVLQQLPEDAVAVVFSAPVQVRENDVDFEYRQNSDLLYLTGTTEPGSVLLLAPGGIPVDGTTVTELLLVPPRSALTETWVGRRFGPARAEAQLGIAKAVSHEQFENVLRDLLADGRRIYHTALPEGVAPGSDLGQQLAFFRTTTEPLTIDGNFMGQRMLELMLTTDDPAMFARLQKVAPGRVEVDALPDALLHEAYDAFLAADSFEAWQTWKHQHLRERPDGAILPRILMALRMEKTEEELRLLQRAIDITVAAHREAMRSVEPGMHEYEAEALVEYVFKRNGAQDPGFPSIVGSGENSVILHYNTNRRPMQAGDLVVIDIGAEVHGYTADVTRTLPVSGRFTAAQRTIYDLVLKAQRAGIAAAEAGRPFGAPGQVARRVIADGLRELGLIQTEDDVRHFFMHGTSHYLGLWVHDVGDYGTLAPGQVITVEPGIYISPSPDVDPQWWHIGVRIEDDVLITADGPVNLSDTAPRTADAIEALMQETGLGNDPAGLVRRDGASASAPGDQ